ncbi:MAG TPA: O-antigen ligase family protein [Methylomirabilota bacterium]|nr:O-antigen ligase family protein [Methylomirabilota bacterium]
MSIAGRVRDEAAATPERAASVRHILLAALVVGLAVSITLSESSLIALALWLLIARPSRPRPAWPLLGPLAAFAAWTIVAALASAAPLDSLAAAKSLLVLAAFWVVLNVLPDARAARVFLVALFAAVSVVAVLAIVQVAVCPPAELAPARSTPVLGRFLSKCGRAHGFYSIYMTLAGVLAVVLASVLPRLLLRPRDAWWAATAWLAGAVALALTFVRGAWIALTVGALGALLALRRVRAALALVAVLVALALVVPGVRDRLRSLGTVHDDTTRDRLAMLDAGLRLVRDHPLTGVGPGQVKKVYPAVAGPEALRRSTSHLHDTPLQIAVERGLPGLAAWLTVFVAFFARALAILRALPPERGDDRALVAGCIAAVATFLVGGLFEHNFGDTEVLLVALALMALPFVVERDVIAARERPA